MKRRDTRGAQVDAGQTVELTTAPGFKLTAAAALAWDRAVAAYGHRVLLTGAWRSYATQEALFRDRYRAGNHAGKPGFTTDVRYWQGSPWTRRAGTAAAAVPGTSNHGGGVAVDVKTARSPGDPPWPTAAVFNGFNDPDRLAFLAVAKRYGWADDEGRQVGEPWHLTYYPNRDTHPPAVTTPPPPEPDKKRNPEMICFRNSANGAVIFVSGGVGARVTNSANYNALTKAGVPTADCDAAQFAIYQARYGA